MELETKLAFFVKKGKVHTYREGYTKITVRDARRHPLLLYPSRYACFAFISAKISLYLCITPIFSNDQAFKQIESCPRRKAEDQQVACRTVRQGSDYHFKVVHQLIPAGTRNSSRNSRLLRRGCQRAPMAF